MNTQLSSQLSSQLPERLPDLVPADRKVVLARLLALRECARLQLTPTEAEVAAMARWWRCEYGLHELDTFARWLHFSGLELPAFLELMRELTALDKLLRHHRHEVEARLRNHLALHSVRAFAAEQPR